MQIRSLLQVRAPEALAIAPAVEAQAFAVPRMLLLKRTVDILGAAALFVLLLPVLGLVALLVLVDSGRPILFRNKVYGWRGRPMTLYKFRTMVPDAEQRLPHLLHLNHAQGRQIKILNDPRRTRIGRILRATSLDELPSLMNVIRGDMSLVGPKTHSYIEYPRPTAELLVRLQMRPGITGLYQATARNHPSESVRAACDQAYIAGWSFWLDIRILSRTLFVVLSCRGGSPELALTDAKLNRLLGGSIVKLNRERSTNFDPGA